MFWFPYLGHISQHAFIKIFFIDNFLESCSWFNLENQTHIHVEQELDYIIVFFENKQGKLISK